MTIICRLIVKIPKLRCTASRLLVVEAGSFAPATSLWKPILIVLLSSSVLLFFSYLTFSFIYLFLSLFLLSVTLFLPSFFSSLFENGLPCHHTYHICHVRSSLGCDQTGQIRQ